MSSTPAATTRSAKREQTRMRMLEAVLAIIVEEGMRGVRHRAVAERAGVSLGTTTYHFESIEDLISSAFQFWRSRHTLAGNPFFHQLGEVLAGLQGRPPKGKQRREIARQVHKLSVDYVCDQLTGKHQDRIVELAFYHESLRSSALRELVLKSWQEEIDYLEEVHRLVGFQQPRADAQMTFSLFRQLEQGTVIAGLARPDRKMISRTLGRHLSLCFDVENLE